MFGISLLEFILFCQQLGLAIAGAAALWGIVFTGKGVWDAHGDRCVTFDWISERLLYLLYGGSAVAFLSWIALGALLPASAHEGIVLVPSMAERVAGYELTAFVYLAWLLFAPLALWLRRATPAQFHRRLLWFYGAHFLIISFLISFSAWAGELGDRQFFFFAHTFHSIMTLGTVVVLDFLFLLSRSSLHLKQHIYPLFPTITKVILVGLALEFVGTGVVFHEAIALTDKFFFMQTVVGILLVNGIVLAGPVTRRMIAAVMERDRKLTHRWEIVADVAGTISVASWFTITFVDFFATLNLSYAQMLGIYLLAIAAAITVHLAWPRFADTVIPERFMAWHRA